MLTALGYGNTELSLLVTDDAGSRELTGRWFGEEKVTDVLSFPLDDATSVTSDELGDGPPHLLGDVVINLDEVSRRAQCPWPLADEIDPVLLAEVHRVLAHGLCHLAGYDHERGPDDAAQMQAQERDLLAALHHA